MIDLFERVAPVLDTIRKDGCMDKSNILAAVEAAYPGSVTPPPKCPKCGTNGDHYCPADVDRGETDDSEDEQ